MLLSDYFNINPLGAISQHLMDSLKIGTPLCRSSVLYTSVPILCVWCVVRVMTSHPRKFHAYPCYRTVHCLGQSNPYRLGLT